MSPSHEPALGPGQVTRTSLLALYADSRLAEDLLNEQGEWHGEWHGGWRAGRRR